MLTPLVVLTAHDLIPVGLHVHKIGYCDIRYFTVRTYFNCTTAEKSCTQYTYTFYCFYHCTNWLPKQIVCRHLQICKFVPVPQVPVWFFCSKVATVDQRDGHRGPVCGHCGPVLSTVAINTISVFFNTQLSMFPTKLSLLHSPCHAVPDLSNLTLISLQTTKMCPFKFSFNFAWPLWTALPYLPK